MLHLLQDNLPVWIKTFLKSKMMHYSDDQTIRIRAVEKHTEARVTLRGAAPM